MFGKNKIKKIETLLIENLIPLSEVILNHIIGPFYEPYNRLIALLEGQEEIGADTIEAALEVVKVRIIRNSMSENINESATMMVNIYSDFIQLGIITYTDKELSQFKLNDDQALYEKNKFAALLKDDISNVYNEITELGHLQKELKQSFMRVRPMMGDGEVDYGDAAKKFGKGALAGAVPLIGVPLLFKEFWDDSQRDKKEQVVYDQFESLWQDYLQQWDKVDSTIRQVILPKVEKLNNKIENDIIKSTVKFTSFMQENGCHLGNYYLNLKNEIEIMNKEIYGD